MFSKWFSKLVDDLLDVRREQPILDESPILKVLTSEEYRDLSQEEWDKLLQSLCSFSRKISVPCGFCGRRPLSLF